MLMHPLPLSTTPDITAIPPGMIASLLETPYIAINTLYFLCKHLATIIANACIHVSIYGWLPNPVTNVVITIYVHSNRYFDLNSAIWVYVVISPRTRISI